MLLDGCAAVRVLCVLRSGGTSRRTVATGGCSSLGTHRVLISVLTRFRCRSEPASGRLGWCVHCVVFRRASMRSRCAGRGLRLRSEHTRGVQRVGDHGARDAQSPRQSLPGHCSFQTLRVAVHVGSASRREAAWIGHDPGTVRCDLHRHTQQHRLLNSAPAPHTGADRSAHSVHQSTPCPAVLRPGAGQPRASGSACASVSGRMSIRQPVRRAARRAFCPSRPMARESW